MLVRIGASLHPRISIHFSAEDSLIPVKAKHNIISNLCNILEAYERCSGQQLRNINLWIFKWKKILNFLRASGESKNERNLVLLVYTVEFKSEVLSTANHQFEMERIPITIEPHSNWCMPS